MAYASVQNAPMHPNGNVSSSVTGTFGSPVTTGNTVIGIVDIGDNSTGITVVDNNSVSATMALEVRDSITTGSNFAVFVKTGVTGGPTAYTATNLGGGTTSTMTITLEEYSGFGAGAALDGTPIGIPLTSSTGANSMNTGNVLTANSGDFVWSFGWNASGGALLTAGTTPAYTLNQNNAGGVLYWSEWLTQGAAGNIAGTWQAGATGSTVVIGVLAITQQGAVGCSRSLAMLGVGCGIAFARKLEENPILTRRGLLLPRRRSLIGHNGGPSLDE